MKSVNSYSEVGNYCFVANTLYVKTLRLQAKFVFIVWCYKLLIFFFFFFFFLHKIGMISLFLGFFFCFLCMCVSGGRGEGGQYSNHYVLYPEYNLINLSFMNEKQYFF